MRIGKFCEINELSMDTIRHYMDLGLIVPEKKGGQYFFDERCQQDLELILDLKSMGFQLNEIKTIFLYKNFWKFTDYEGDTYYQSLFTDKYKKLEIEIKNLVEMKDKIKQKLNDFADKSHSSGTKIGIDIKVLDLLKCLKCGDGLTLLDGVISRNQIIDGKLVCDCGEEYLIDSGILIVGEPFESPAGLSIEQNIYNYIHNTAPNYLEHLNKGLHWSKRKFEQLDLQHKVILELGSGAGFFLRNIYQDLPDNCLYIAVDRNLAWHRFLKSLLERTGAKRNILFICADFREIPIQKKNVDVIVDLSGTSNYSFEHEEFLLHEVDSLAKCEGFLLGSYICFKNFSPISKVDAKYRDNFTSNKIKKNIETIGYRHLEERTSEYVDKGGKFEDFFVEGEEIYSYSFFGKR